VKEYSLNWNNPKDIITFLKLLRKVNCDYESIRMGHIGDFIDYARSLGVNLDEKDLYKLAEKALEEGYNFTVGLIYIVLLVTRLELLYRGGKVPKATYYRWAKRFKWVRKALSSLKLTSEDKEGYNLLSILELWAESYYLNHLLKDPRARRWINIVW